MVYTTILAFWILTFACITRAVSLQVAWEPDAKEQGYIVYTGIATWNSRPDFVKDDNSIIDGKLAALARAAHQIMRDDMTNQGLSASSFPDVMSSLIVKDNQADEKDGKYTVYFGSSVRISPAAGPGKSPGTMLSSILHSMDDDNIVFARINAILEDCINDSSVAGSKGHAKHCGEPVAIQKYLQQKDPDYKFKQFQPDQKARIAAYSNSAKTIFAPCNNKGPQLGCRVLSKYISLPYVPGNTVIDDNWGREPDDASTPKFVCSA